MKPYLIGFVMGVVLATAVGVWAQSPWLSETPAFQQPLPHESIGERMDRGMAYDRQAAPVPIIPLVPLTPPPLSRPPTGITQQQFAVPGQRPMTCVTFIIGQMPMTQCQ